MTSKGPILTFIKFPYQSYESGDACSGPSTWTKSYLWAINKTDHDILEHIMSFSVGREEKITVPDQYCYLDYLGEIGITDHLNGKNIVYTVVSCDAKDEYNATYVIEIDLLKTMKRQREVANKDMNEQINELYALRRTKDREIKELQDVISKLQK